MNEYINNGLSFVLGVAFCNLLWGVWYGVSPTTLSGMFLPIVLAALVLVLRKHAQRHEEV